MTDNALMAAVATRKLVADVFPRFPFVIRLTDPEHPEAGGNLDRMDITDTKVASTRPATAQEIQMYLAFETTRDRLAALLLGKASDESVALQRALDFEDLLIEALKWAPELAMVRNPNRLSRLRALMRGAEAGNLAPGGNEPPDTNYGDGTVISVKGEESR